MPIASEYSEASPAWLTKDTQSFKDSLNRQHELEHSRVELSLQPNQLSRKSPDVMNPSRASNALPTLASRLGNRNFLPEDMYLYSQSTEHVWPHVRRNADKMPESFQNLKLQPDLTRPSGIPAGAVPKTFHIQNGQIQATPMSPPPPRPPSLPRILPSTVRIKQAALQADGKSQFQQPWRVEQVKQQANKNYRSINPDVDSAARHYSHTPMVPMVNSIKSTRRVVEINPPLLSQTSRNVKLGQDSQTKNDREVENPQKQFHPPDCSPASFHQQV